MNAPRICHGLCATTFALLSLSAASHSNPGNASADYGVMLGEDSGFQWMARNAQSGARARRCCRSSSRRDVGSGVGWAFAEDSGSFRLSAARQLALGVFQQTAQTDD
jgi:hypothetical protein